MAASICGACHSVLGQQRQISAFMQEQPDALLQELRSLLTASRYEILGTAALCQVVHHKA